MVLLGFTTTTITTTVLTSYLLFRNVPSCVYLLPCAPMEQTQCALLPSSCSSSRSRSSSCNRSSEEFIEHLPTKQPNSYVSFRPQGNNGLALERVGVGSRERRVSRCKSSAWLPVCHLRSLPIMPLEGFVAGVRGVMQSFTQGVISPPRAQYRHCECLHCPSLSAM